MEVLPWGGAREGEDNSLGGSTHLGGEYTWLSHGSFGGGGVEGNHQKHKDESEKASSMDSFTFTQLTFLKTG